MSRAIVDKAEESADRTGKCMLGCAGRGLHETHPGLQKLGALGNRMCSHPQELDLGWQVGQVEAGGPLCSAQGEWDEGGSATSTGVSTCT